TECAPVNTIFMLRCSLSDPLSRSSDLLLVLSADRRGRAVGEGASRRTRRNIDDFVIRSRRWPHIVDKGAGVSFVDEGAPGPVRPLPLHAPLTRPLPSLLGSANRQVFV